MNILITGGAGFIGAHLTAALLEQGNNVATLDNLSTGSFDNIRPFVDHPHFSFAIDDLSNSLVLDRLASEADAIVHLAAAVGVQLVVERPTETIETNVLGTHAVLHAAQRYRCRTLIASTSEVYGKGVSIPFNESNDLLLGSSSNSRWCYAASKLLDEFLGLAAYQEHGLPVTILRFFNTVGPGQSGRYGMVVPRFMRQALRGEPISVYGDGEQSRCFCHVADTVRAVAALLDEPEATVGEIYNIGATEEITINQLAQRVIEEANSTSQIEHIPYSEAYAPGFEDMRRRVPDIRKLHAAIGWQPEQSLDQHSGRCGRVRAIEIERPDSMNPKPVVLQVTAIPLTAARFLLPLANGLRNDGCVVHFACSEGPERPELTAAGFPVQTVAIDRRIRTVHNLPALARLTELMRRQRYDAVHAHTPVAGLLARVAARLAGVPVVLYTLHGSVWNEGDSVRSRLFSLAERTGAACTDHAFVLNEYDGDELTRRGFYKPDQITVLGVGGGGVNLDRFRREALPADAGITMRSELGIPAGVQVIGFLGRVVREKGILDLLEAFVAVSRQIPDVHLVLAGGTVVGEWDAVSEDEMFAAVDHDGDLWSRVHITGFRDDAPHLLTAMDVVVLPSWREGFGMALAEAGAMGIPVIGTDTPGGKAAIVHDENGLLIPVRRPQELAGAITSVLTQPSLAKRLGEAGRSHAVARFGQQRTIERQLEVYRRLLPIADSTAPNAAGSGVEEAVRS